MAGLAALESEVAGLKGHWLCLATPFTGRYQSHSVIDIEPYLGRRLAGCFEGAAEQAGQYFFYQVLAVR